MGRLGMPSLLAQAAAPWIGAMLLQRLGATGMLSVVASVAFLNVGLSLALFRASANANAHNPLGDAEARP